MKKGINYLKDFDSVSDEIKFISNSMTRLKVLISLNKKPNVMKDLCEDTNLSYSPVSSTIHGLELREMVYRKNRKYFLTNSTKLLLNNIVDFKDIHNFLDASFNIFQNHNIGKIPMESVLELNLLNNSQLLESNGFDINKFFNFIDDTLAYATNARCILPVFHHSFNKKLNELVNNNKFVEIEVAENVFHKYEEFSDVKFISSFRGKHNFLLILTNEIMIFGLFRNDGIFDQNRLLAATDLNGLKWGYNLFRNFKKINR